MAGAESGEDRRSAASADLGKNVAVPQTQIVEKLIQAPRPTVVETIAPTGQIIETSEVLFTSL